MTVTLLQERLKVRREEPFHAGPESPAVVGTFRTPAEQFFVRNHGTVPDVDLATFRLHVGGHVCRSFAFALDDLRRRFPRHTVTATLQCAGNRRRELSAVRPIPGELDWGVKAIGNAEWTGVALQDLLVLATPKRGAKHVGFTGLDVAAIGGVSTPFGASIPLQKALAPEVLLAYEMNGHPLPRAHGGPLRVVIPGYIGARSVKWLARIDVLDAPSTNPFQAQAYRLQTPGEDRGVFPGSEALNECSVTSAICDPAEGETVSAGRTTISGYAYAGGSPVERVEVRVDGKRSFSPARLLDPPAPWVWTRWRCEVELAPGSREIVARAFDADGNGQPEELASVWNPKGYGNTAWHRIRVEVLGRSQRFVAVPANL